jgi:hypothetical protein
MIFNSSTVQRYILNNAKLIATIRRKGYYKVGKRIILKVGDKRFYGKVIAIAPITPFSLGEYTCYSGFDSAEEWISEAERLHQSSINPNEFEIIVIELL